MFLEARAYTHSAHIVCKLHTVRKIMHDTIGIHSVRLFVPVHGIMKPQEQEKPRLRRHSNYPQYQIDSE